MILQKQNQIQEYLDLNRELVNDYILNNEIKSLEDYIENTFKILNPLQKDVFDLKNGFKEILTNIDGTKVLHLRNKPFENYEHIFDDEEDELIQNDLE